MEGKICGYCNKHPLKEVKVLKIDPPWEFEGEKFYYQVWYECTGADCDWRTMTMEGEIIHKEFDKKSGKIIETKLNGYSRDKK